MSLRFLEESSLCLGLSFLLMVCLATAASAKTINIKATHPDAVYEQRKAKNALSAAMSQLNSGGDDHCNVNGSISLFERNRLRKSSTFYISVTDEADEFLFDDPTIFRNLEVASLCSNRYNGSHLKSLLMNYPNLKSISISQVPSLADDQLKGLKQFRQLTGLELWCHLSTPKAILDSLPDSLSFLQICETLPLSRLTRLAELRINNCRVDSSFFEQLNPTSLELMYLNNIDLVPGALQHLDRFKALREILVYNSNIDDADLQSVRALGYISLRSYGSDKQRIANWNRAEKFFKDKKYQRAADNYKGSVFSAPSTYGYLQLARCYLELGDIRLACKYRDHAAATEPDSKEITEFNSVMELRGRSQ